MHLQLSDEVRSLASGRENLANCLLSALEESWPAFYLGSVAPDYQTICGIPRAETHFYSMPPESRSQGPRKILAEYPQLLPGRSLEPGQAMCMAAYLVHLQLDLNWHYDVVLPYFANAAVVGDPRQGYLLHLILLTYLDQVAFHSLPDTAPAVLSAAEYDHWLPFATDDQIGAWHEFLLEQMGPDAATQTVQIFAGRLRMTPDEFSAKLSDLDWMNRELFSRIPVAKIQRQLIESVSQCLDLVEAYWFGRFY